MLLVKPDGISKNLVNTIREIILANNLVIEQEVVRKLAAETVSALYWDISDVRHRDYFPQLIEFMSLTPVHIFIVQGENAVKKVRAIIGKRDSAFGIRGRWAESAMKNIAHGPHSVLRAKKEIQLLLGGKNVRKVFLIGGMSESGKSTFGRYLHSKGIIRLKIVSFLKNIMDREGVTGDFYAWNNQNVQERPEWVRQEFTKEFLRWAKQHSIEYCCLESLYGPELGLYMSEQLGSNKVVMVYINMPLEIRLQRQIIRQNLSSIKEAEDYLLPRDEIKKAWRVPEIEGVADIVIDNSGSLEDLYRMADEMIAQHCPDLIVD